MSKDEVGTDVVTELPPSVDALTEALLWAAEWTNPEFETLGKEPEGTRWFFDGSLREFAETLVEEWEHAQDIARRRAAGEFGPPRNGERSAKDRV